MPVKFKLKNRRPNKVQVLRVIGNRINEVQEDFEKGWTKEVFEFQKDVIEGTPVWRDMDPNGSWEKLRRKRGDVPGTAARGWKGVMIFKATKTIFRLINLVPYIKVLEFGGFGNFARFRIWGNYAGKTTKRTRTTTKTKGTRTTRKRTENTTKGKGTTTKGTPTKAYRSI